MTTCYKCDKSPRERWGRTEWWPVWFSGQKIDFYLNPHATSLFKFSSAWGERIQFEIGIFLVCVRQLVVWWIDMRAPLFLSEGTSFFFFFLTPPPERRGMLCLLCSVTLPPGYYNPSVPQRRSGISLKCAPSLTFLIGREGVHSLQLGIDVIQSLLLMLTVFEISFMAASFLRLRDYSQVMLSAKGFRQYPPCLANSV